jgi:uncharacterized protein YggE
VFIIPAAKDTALINTLPASRRAPKALAIALAALLPLSAQAAPSTSNGPSIDGSLIAPGDAMVTVSAESQAHRVPDIAMFTAGVTTQGKTASQALTANTQAMTAVIAELKKASVQPRDIQTSNLSVSPIYEEQAAQPVIRPRRTVGPVIIGYQVSNQVNVRQRKLTEYGATIDALVAAGANQINGPSFTLDEPATAMNEARLEAVKAARARADLYARAAGMRVLRIISIAEGGSNFPQPMMFARAKAMDAAAPVEAGEVNLSANVTVQFELAP